jgi:hypothetical protein
MGPKTFAAYQWGTNETIALKQGGLRKAVRSQGSLAAQTSHQAPLLQGEEVSLEPWGCFLGISPSPLFTWLLTLLSGSSIFFIIFFGYIKIPW